MSGAEFLDTNVLLYSISADARKADIVEMHLLASPARVISVQVLNEFANVAQRKYGVGWARPPRGVGDTFRTTLIVQPLTLETHRRGLAISERYRLGLYDCLLLAAAILAGCTVFHSEDLQHGRVIEGILEIRNPFAV